MQTRGYRSIGGACCLTLSLFAAAFSAAKADELPGTELVSGPADWSGFYVGVQGGFAHGDTGWTFPVDSYFTLPTGRRSFDADPSGGFLGGHITWNHQIGAIVVGAELAINGGGIEDTQTGVFTPLFPGDGFVTSVTAFGTLTGRLGYAHDNFLLYGTGGLARGHLDYHTVSAPPGGGVIGDVKLHQNGWTLGGGLEYMLFPNVVVGAEYDYLHFGDETTQVATTGTPSNDPFVLYTHDVGMHAVSLRLSVKLDTPPVTPAP